METGIVSILKGKKEQTLIYEFDGKAPQIHPTAYISESATIIGDVTIGADCYVGPGAVIRADNKPIMIGEGTAVEDCVVIHAGGDDSNGCLIGKRVTIGHSAIVHSNIVADYANIGMGAITSLFSEIGEYAVVAEGAVVKQGQVIPPRVIVGGTPAKVLRELKERDIQSWESSKEWYIDLAHKCSTPGVLKRLD